MSATTLLPIRPLPAREVMIDPLVRRAQAGDEQAFASLYDGHAGRVHAVCLRLSGDPVRAAELVQDVFVRAWRGLRAFRGESTFGTWLHRLAVNVVLQGQRSDGRRRKRVELGEDLHPDGVDGQAAAVDVGLHLDLERAVAMLPDVLREVFVLHDVEGFPHDEIAQSLGIPVGTSRSHLFRARRLLRSALQ